MSKRYLLCKDCKSIEFYISLAENSHPHSSTLCRFSGFELLKVGGLPRASTIDLSGHSVTI